MIQAFLLGLCFENSVNRSLTSGVYTTGKMFQEEAVITAVPGTADLAPVAFLRFKKLLFFIGTNPKSFSSPLTRWNVNKMLLLDWKCWVFPFLLAIVWVYCSYLSLLLQKKLHVAILAVGGSATSVQHCVDPMNSPLLAAMPSWVKLYPDFCQDPPYLWMDPLTLNLQIIL